jgi:hypothetical protein
MIKRAAAKHSFAAALFAATSDEIRDFLADVEVRIIVQNDR